MIFRNFLRTGKVVILSLLVLVMIGGLGVLVFAGENPAAAPQLDAPPRELSQLQDSFRTISSKVLPSVVEILTTTVQKQVMPSFPNFDRFFGPDFQPLNQIPQRTQKVEGLGSGIMIRSSGNTIYVLTNNHVVENSKKIQIILNDGRKFDGKLVGTDPRRDLAVVSFTTDWLHNKIVLANLGDSDQLKVGDWVMAVGNPLGLDFTVTHGIVSALGRHGGPSDSANMDSYIQTDAPINRGNSGGALVNLQGQVVGINTWIASPDGGSVGLGFAIPINLAKAPVEQIIGHGVVKYGWLGALVTNVSDDEAKDLGLPSTKGSFIPSVFRDSPAEKAGILPGDFVTQINGKEIQDANTLVQTIGNSTVGQNVNFQILRQGHSLTKNVVIQERGKESAISALRLWPGLTVTDLNQDVRDQLNLDKAIRGVAVAQVEPKSTTEIAGLKSKDVITKIDDVPIDNIKDFYRLFNSKESEVKIGFVRQGVDLSIDISK